MQIISHDNLATKALDRKLSGLSNIINKFSIWQKIIPPCWLPLVNMLCWLTRYFPCVPIYSENQISIALPAICPSIRPQPGPARWAAAQGEDSQGCSVWARRRYSSVYIWLLIEVFCIKDEATFQVLPLYNAIDSDHYDRLPTSYNRNTTLKHVSHHRCTGIHKW